MKKIDGCWSEPVFLNSSGFDPSLFHDDDGRKWLVNMDWDFREGVHPLSGILLQEYSERQQRLIGKPIKIFKGTHLGCVEDPHIYKKNGYYHLICAEGGTGWRHAVTSARSKNIEGPYEVHPNNPILTSYNKNVTLQKAGHASLVETPDGWYMAHLCGRPLPHTKCCTLGRETAIQKIKWENDWPMLADGTNTPSDTVECSLDEVPVPPEITRDNFSEKN